MVGDTIVVNVIHNQQAVVGSGVLVRGDLAKVRIGKYCLILENSVIRPSCKLLSGGLSFFPTQIGSYTHIGKDCVIEALKIGSYVHIGDNCIIVCLAFVYIAYTTLFQVTSYLRPGKTLHIK
jgi:dynactin-5